MKKNQTDLTVCWCETVVCEAAQHRSQFVPSQLSPSPLAGPSDGRRTRCVPPPSAWSTTNHAITKEATKCAKNSVLDIEIFRYWDRECIRTCWKVHCAGDRRPDSVGWCSVQCGCPCRGCRLYQRWVETVPSGLTYRKKQAGVTNNCIPIWANCWL